MFFENPFVKELRVVTGIDLGASAVRMVTMRRGEDGRPEVVRVSTHPIAFQGKGDSETAEEDSGAQSRLVEALRAAKEAHGVPLGKVVVAMPRARTMMRYVELPSTTPEEVEEMLMFDVERHVPFPIDQMQLGFTVVEQREESSLVMLAAARIEEVNRLVQLCAEAGVEVEVVDVDVLATCTSYLYDRQDTTPVRAVLDIGRTKADLGVLVGDQVRFSRSSSLGEERLRECLGALEAGNPPEEAHPEWISELVTNLQRLFKAYECQPDSQDITEVVLCGGLAALPGLAQGLAGQLKRRVRAAFPELDGIAGMDGALGPQTTLALGLALRSLDEPVINLLPASVTETRRKSHQKYFLRNAAIYAGVILVLLTGVVGAKFQAKWMHQTALYDALAEIEPKIRNIKRQKKELGEIQANIDSKHSFYKVMADLWRITPEHVMYLNLNFEKQKRLEIRGRIPTQAEYFDLVKILDESEHFKTVEPLGVTWTTMYDKKAVREFEVNCILASNEDYRPKRARRSSSGRGR